MYLLSMPFSISVNPYPTFGLGSVHTPNAMPGCLLVLFVCLIIVDDFAGLGFGSTAAGGRGL
jgi:hypothetical protein